MGTERTAILHIMLLYVPQKKEIHTGLEQGWVNNYKIYIFGVNYLLKFFMIYVMLLNGALLNRHTCA